MNNHVQMPKTAAEWSAQYVREWLREGETGLWAGKALQLRGKPVITVVHCAGFDGAAPCIEIRVGKRVHQAIPATRNWQNERRTAVRIGMHLAGKRGTAAEVEAALAAVKARQPAISQRVAELTGLIAERLFQANGTWSVQDCFDAAATRPSTRNEARRTSASCRTTPRPARR
jgi:hypothetical protein